MNATCSLRGVLQFNPGWRVTLLLITSLNAQLVTCFAQGPLGPLGPPAPTMKTLDQIDAKLEKRTPISSLPFNIFAPGSYYLTGNVIASPGQTGININSDDVTLDLNGFVLDGGVNRTNNIVEGVSVLFHTNVCVRNGTIRNWGGYGVNAFFSSNSRFENLRVADGGQIGLAVGVGCFVSACSVTTSGLTGNPGISTGDGTTIKDCVVTTNHYGISTGTGCAVINCTARMNLFGILAGDRSTVKDCAVTESQFHGIWIAGDCVVTGNHSSHNGRAAPGAGITASGGGNRIEGNHVRDNSGAGISVPAGTGNIVIRNTSGNNAGGNYSPASGVGIGPVGSPDTATSPWANF